MGATGHEGVPHVVSLQAYDVTYAGGSGTHIGLPSPHLTFVLPLDEPLEVSWAGAPESRTSSWASLSGLHTSPAEIHHGGRQRGLQLALTPAAARMLWGVPAAALSGRLLDLADVAPDWADLPERLAEAPSWPARRQVVADALRRSADRRAATSTRAEVGRALALLTRGTRVADVAQDVGYSRRRLSTLVREEVGVSPKQFQRLARFHHGHRLLLEAALAGRPSIARAAAAAGYADQAHLAREWSELAGCSPSAWLAREFPIVQATDRPDGRA